MAYTIIKLTGLNNNQMKNNSLGSSPDLDELITQPPSVGFPESNMTTKPTKLGFTQPNNDGYFSIDPLDNDRFVTQVLDVNDTMSGGDGPGYPSINSTITNSTGSTTNSTGPAPFDGPVWWIVTAASAGFILIIILVFCCLCLRKRKPNGGGGKDDSCCCCPCEQSEAEVSILIDEKGGNVDREVHSRPLASDYFGRTAAIPVSKYGTSDSFLPVVTRKQVTKKPYYGAVRLVKTGHNHKA